MSLRTISTLVITNTGSPRKVQILCSQGIVLLQNRTKLGLVLNTQNEFLERLFSQKKGKKPHYTEKNLLFSTI